MNISLYEFQKPSTVLQNQFYRFAALHLATYLQFRSILFTMRAIFFSRKQISKIVIKKTFIYGQFNGTLA